MYKNGSRDPHHAQAVLCLHTKFGDSCFSCAGDMGHVTLTTPLLRVI